MRERLFFSYLPPAYRSSTGSKYLGFSVSVRGLSLIFLFSNLSPEQAPISLASFIFAFYARTFIVGCWLVLSIGSERGGNF